MLNTMRPKKKNLRYLFSLNNSESITQTKTTKETNLFDDKDNNSSFEQTKCLYENTDLQRFDTHYDLQQIGNVDFMVSIGGDGSFIDAANLVGDLGIPLVGVNTGRIGFLSAIKNICLNSLHRAIISEMATEIRIKIDCHVVTSLLQPNVVNFKSVLCGSAAITDSDKATGL